MTNVHNDGEKNQFVVVMVILSSQKIPLSGEIAPFMVLSTICLTKSFLRELFFILKPQIREKAGRNLKKPAYGAILKG